MSNATVTIPLIELDELRQRRVDAENELARVRVELAEARLNSSDDGVTRSLTKLSRHLLKVAAFAVSQMPPEASKGWPSDDLDFVVALLPTLPDYSTNDRELASDFSAFSSECQRWARYRTSPEYLNRQKTVEALSKPDLTP